MLAGLQKNHYRFLAGIWKNRKKWGGYERILPIPAPSTCTTHTLPDYTSLTFFCMILPGGPQEIQSPQDTLISDPERKKRERRWEGWREAGNKGEREKGKKRGSAEEKGIQKETKTNKYKQHVHVQ